MVCERSAGDDHHNSVTVKWVRVWFITGYEILILLLHCLKCSNFALVKGSIWMDVYAMQEPKYWCVFIVIGYIFIDFWWLYILDDGPLTKALVSLMLTLNARHKGSVKTVRKLLSYWSGLYYAVPLWFRLGNWQKMCITIWEILTMWVY